MRMRDGIWRDWRRMKGSGMWSSLGFVWKNLFCIALKMKLVEIKGQKLTKLDGFRSWPLTAQMALKVKIACFNSINHSILSCVLWAFP